MAKNRKLQLAGTMGYPGSTPEQKAAARAELAEIHVAESIAKEQEFLSIAARARMVALLSAGGLVL